jgi:hypothetical protein
VHVRRAILLKALTDPQRRDPRTGAPVRRGGELVRAAAMLDYVAFLRRLIYEAAASRAAYRHAPALLRLLDLLDHVQPQQSVRCD